MIALFTWFKCKSNQGSEEITSTSAGVAVGVICYNQKSDPSLREIWLVKQGQCCNLNLAWPQNHYKSLILSSLTNSMLVFFHANCSKMSYINVYLQMWPKSDPDESNGNVNVKDYSPLAFYTLMLLILLDHLIIN